MNILAVVTRGISSLIQAAGDAILSVKVAASVPFDAQPGEDYEPTWLIYSGRGFWEKAESADYPGTVIQTTDRTMVLLECAYAVDMHDYVNADDQVYHVYGVKSEMVGSTRVLQKLLLRIENKAGIAWESRDLLTA